MGMDRIRDNRLALPLGWPRWRCKMRDTGTEIQVRLTPEAGARRAHGACDHTPAVDSVIQA